MLPCEYITTQQRYTHFVYLSNYFAINLHILFMKKDNSLILNKIKEYYNIKKDADFARFLGISPQLLSNWHARNTLDVALLYTKCLDLNPEWLLTGNGEMIKTTTTNQTIEKPETIYVSKSQREKDLELTIKVQQELIDSLKNRLQQYEEGVQDVGVADVG